MEDKKFRYYIIDATSGQYYTFDGSGNVVFTSTKTELENTADGWQEIQIGIERDLKKLGITRTFTLPLALVKRIRKIIRTIIFTGNTEQTTYLLIEKLNVVVTTTYDYQYSQYYKGEIDLSEYKYEDYKDTIPLKEIGIESKIKACENTVVEIDIDSDPEKVQLKNDGLTLAEKGAFLPVDGLDMSLSAWGQQFFMPIAYLNSEGKSTGIGFFSQQIQNVAGLTWAQTQSQDNYLVAASDNNTAAISLNVIGTIKYTCTRNDIGAGFRMRFITSQQSIGVQNAYQLPLASSNIAGQTYSIAVNMTIPLLPGEKLFLEGIFTGSLSGTDVIEVFSPDSSLTFNYENRYHATITNWLKPSTVLKRLMEKNGFTAADCDTTFLLTWDHILIGSGDSNRGLAGAKVKTSISQFSEFIRVVTAAGQGIINGKLAFHEYLYFLDNSDPIDLGEIKELKISLANDQRGNVVKCGYPPKDIEDVNGKYSFNNTTVWAKEPWTSNAKEINFICPYISDAYYIEINRINLEGKTTTDNNSDNEILIVNSDAIPSNTYNVGCGTILGGNFMIITGAAGNIDLFRIGSQFTLLGGVNVGTYTVTQSSVYNTNDLLVVVAESVTPESSTSKTVGYLTRRLKRVSYVFISGIPQDDTIYNIEDLTPLRILFRQKTWIWSLFYGFTSQQLVFKTTDKNKSLITNDGTTTYIENSDFNIDVDRLFLPFIFEFETIVPLNLLELLEAGPNRCFSFQWQGDTYKGFLLKAGISPNNNKSQSFKLLCCPDVDLTNLI